MQNAETRREIKMFVFSVFSFEDASTLLSGKPLRLLRTNRRNAVFFARFLFAFLFSRQGMIGHSDLAGVAAPVLGIPTYSAFNSAASLLSNFFIISLHVKLYPSCVNEVQKSA